MTDPGTIGARLKAERERRGLSPQKAADELHLDGWVIDALEADDYGRIGPSVYAKGHLKRYAALLGLPSAEIMAGYESQHQAPGPAASQPANVRLRTGPPVVNDLPWPLIAGSAAVVLLAVGVLWWKPWQPRGVVAAAAPSGAAATPDSRATSSPAKPDAMAGMGRARLRLSFSADSWVDVHDAAGRRVFAGNGRANSVKTIAGVAPMRVYLGSASGVQLEINNRAVAIGPQFWAGDVARFEAGADGVLRRDSRVAAPGAATPAAATPGAAIAGAHPSG